MISVMGLMHGLSECTFHDLLRSTQHLSDIFGHEIRQQHTNTTRQLQCCERGSGAVARRGTIHKPLIMYIREVLVAWFCQCMYVRW